jgi:hypothetical protein
VLGSWKPKLEQGKESQGHGSPLTIIRLPLWL